MNEMYKRFGLADTASVDEKMARFSAEAEKGCDKATLTAMADDLDKHGDHEAAKAMSSHFRQMAQTMANPAQENAQADQLEQIAAEEREEAAKLAETINLPKVGMSRAAIMSAAREQLVAMRATTVPRDEVKALKDQIAALQARNAATDAAACDAKIKAFARTAIADGRWDPDGEAALVELVTANLPAGETGEKRAMSAIGKAEKHLKAKGFWTMARNYTAGGAPVGSGEHAPHNFSSGNAPAHRGQSPAEAEYKAEIATVMASRKVDHAVAMSIVAREKPQLLAALRS